MAPILFSRSVRCVLVTLILLCGTTLSGCGSDENEINIPENPLPIPGPEARLSRGTDQSANDTEQSQTAP
ncbi:hypothetical protein Pr1d_47880 [Bythopirellula goksoeyrii]|uniref:Secreted protein n=1 Tax=Bythopirellula goksoeyrii TaxID=1400387 RepID=A0A5B9QIC1_9BACT|nr:hypothetical protein Pr1d_47880 [Bythopirellula goksoeyrii]